MGALVDEGTQGRKARSEAAEEGAPLLGTYGGKITGNRHVAQDAVDALAERLPALSGSAWTAHEPLPGGDFRRGRRVH